MVSRELYLYESLLSTGGMGLALSFLGQVTEDRLRKAFYYIQKEHPILRMVIEKTEDNKQAFVEKPDLEMQLESVNGSEIDIEKSLTAWVNQSRDHALSQIFFQYHPPHGARMDHVLLVVINHAGTDGDGILHIFASFCEYLGKLVTGSDVVEPTSREFCDILGRVVMPEGLSKPEVPDNILDGPDVKKAEVVEGESPGIRHIHERLSVETTDKLIKMSRSLGYTIQGVICTAMMMSAAKSVEKTHPLPQKMACLAPVNMRQRVQPPLQAEDCVCGSGGLWWWQTISSDQKLSDIATTASKEVRRTLEEGYGLGFWKWLDEGFWMPKYTVMGTSLGIYPIKGQYDDLEVRDIVFGGGAYEYDPATTIPLVRHFSTFRDQMRITFAHGWPEISDESARALLQVEMKCIYAMAGPNAGTITVEEFLKELD